MKLFYINSFLTIFFFSTFAQTERYPSFVWAKTALSPGIDQYYDIAVDKSGYVYALGWFNDDLIISTDTFSLFGINDILFVKYDSDGNYIWGQQLGGSNSDRGYGIVISDQDEIYITGQFGGYAYMGTNGNGQQQYISGSGTKGFISRFQPDGTLVWVKKMDGTNSLVNPESLALDGSDVLLIGSFTSNMNFSGGLNLTATGYGFNIFVAKVNNAGTFLWSFSEESANNAYGYDIAVSSTGDFAITGWFDDTLDLSGNILIAKGLGDAYVAYYNQGGTLQWFDQIGGYSIFTQGADQGTCAAFDRNDNLWVTGRYIDTVNFGVDTLISLGYWDVYLAQYNAGGTVLQSKSIGGAALHDYASGLEIDYLNNVVLGASGYISVTVDDSTLVSTGSLDFMVFQFSPDGKLNWSKTGGCTANDYLMGIALNKFGEVYLAGGVGDINPITFDTITITPTGTGQWYEATIAKLSWDSLVATSIDDMVMKNWNIFPNPSDNGQVYISGIETTERVLIYDISGKFLLTKLTHPYLALDISMLKSGIYFLKIQSQEGCGILCVSE